MKISRRIPEAEVRTVEVKAATERKPGWFKCFLLTPIEIGETTFDGYRTWVADDGIVINNLRDVEKYFLNRQRTEGQTLAPGKYNTRAKKIRTTKDKIVIETTDGDEIVINTRGTE